MQAAGEAACGGHVEILKYFVEERKMIEEVESSPSCQALQSMAKSIASNTNRRGESTSSCLARRSRSVLRAPRLRKLLA